MKIMFSISYRKDQFDPYYIQDGGYVDNIEIIENIPKMHPLFEDIIFTNYIGAKKYYYVDTDTYKFDGVRQLDEYVSEAIQIIRNNKLKQLLN